MRFDVGRILKLQFPWTNKALPEKPKPSGVNEGPDGCVSDKVKPKPESKEFGEIVREMNADYQIAFANFVLAANVAAVQVTVSVENGDDRSDAIQQKLQTLWDQTVPAMMGAVGFGRVAFEKDWDYDTKNRITFIASLAAMEFEDTKLKLTPEHKFDGFKLKVSDSPEQWEHVKQKDAWWLAIDATPKNPHGISQYKGAVEKAWRRKRESQENLAMYVRRYAIRGGVVHGPMTEPDELTGLPVSCVEKMAAAAENLWTGGLMYLPNDAHPNPDMAKAGRYKYDFTEANVTAMDPAPIQATIDKEDVAILRAIGIPEKAGIEGDGVGSFAQLTEQILTLFARVDTLVAQFVRSFQKYCVEAVREANYEDESGPTFHVNAVKLTNRPDSFVITLLTALVANPQFAQVILGGGVDLRNLLEQVGLPVTTEFEEVAKQVAARFQVAAGLPGAMPAPAGGGVLDDASGDGPTPGEFGNSSRLQWTRNVKAIRDILQELIDGKSSPAFAQTMLEALGLTPDRAKALIDDATSDGTIDDPDLADAGAVTMANALEDSRVRRYWYSILAGDSAAQLVCPGVNVITFSCGTGAGGFQKGNHCWKQTHHMTREEHRSKAEKHGIKPNKKHNDNRLASEAEYDRLDSHVNSLKASGAHPFEISKAERERDTHGAQAAEHAKRAFAVADRIHSQRVAAAVNRGNYVPDHVVAQYPKHARSQRERREIANAGKRYGVGFESVRAQMPDSYAQLSQDWNMREVAKATARKKMGGITARTINRWEDAGKDYAHPSIKRWDEGAQEVALEHPELGIHPDNASQAVWDLIKEGARPKPKPNGADVAEHAAQTVAHYRMKKRKGRKPAPSHHDTGFGSFGDAFEDDFAPVSNQQVAGVPFSNLLDRQREQFTAFLNDLSVKKK